MNSNIINIKNFSPNRDPAPSKNIFSHILAYEPVPMHGHKWMEIIVVNAGKCKHNLNGEINTISTGELLFILPTDKHQFIPTTANEEFMHRDIIFSLPYFNSVCDSYSQTFYQDILSKKYSLYFKLKTDQITQLENYIQTISLSTSSEAQNLATHALCSFLLNIIIEYHLQSITHYPQWVNLLISRFQSPSYLSFTLPEVIKDIPFNQSYICRQFKKYVGMTMTDYFNQHKMAYALSLLESTDFSMEQICETISFNNISHFYKLFKKIYHITPNQARISK